MDPLAARAKRGRAAPRGCAPATDCHRRGRHRRLAGSGGRGGGAQSCARASAWRRSTREITAAAQGYVAPERMTELLRALLAEQHGLKLVSLPTAGGKPVASPPRRREAAGESDTAIARRRSRSVPASRRDRGRGRLRQRGRVPARHRSHALAHPLAQARAAAGEYPVNRVRLVIGALSLSRDWMKYEGRTPAACSRVVGDGSAGMRGRRRIARSHAPAARRQAPRRRHVRRLPCCPP